MFITLLIWIWNNTRQISLGGAQTHKSTLFRSEIEKYVCSFLVQMKTAEFAFEINWPLVRAAAFAFWELIFILLALKNAGDSQSAKSLLLYTSLNFVCWGVLPKSDSHCNNCYKTVSKYSRVSIKRPDLLNFLVWIFREKFLSKKLVYLKFWEPQYMKIKKI